MASTKAGLNSRAERLALEKEQSSCEPCFNGLSNSSAGLERPREPAPAAAASLWDFGLEPNTKLPPLTSPLAFGPQVERAPLRMRGRALVDLLKGLQLRAKAGIAREQLLQDARSYVPLILGKQT